MIRFLVLVGVSLLNLFVGQAQIVKLQDYTLKNSAAIGSYQGISVREGGFSGMSYIPGTNGKEYWVVCDRGPNLDCDIANPSTCRPTYNKMSIFPTFAPKIHRVRVNGDSIQILQSIPIRRPGGTITATGIMNPTGFGSTALEVPSTDTVLNCANFNAKTAAKDVWGIDSEGILVDKDGNFWICEEGQPSIWKISPQGIVLKRYTPYANIPGSQAEDFAIDSVFKYRKNNRGFENICMAPNGKIYAVIQSPLLYPTQAIGEATRIHRMLEIDPQTNAMRMLVYLNDGPVGSGSNQVRFRDWKLGDITAINDSTFLVIEAGARGTTDIKKVYLININGATAVHSGLYGGVTLEALVDSVGLAAQGIVAARKTLFMDLLANGWPASYDKSEGLTIVNDSTIALCNDNDFAITSLLTDGIASATSVNTHILTYRLQGANKLQNFRQPTFLSTPAQPGLDYSFVVLGCNRVEDVDSVGNPSTANVYQLNRVFSEIASMNPLPRYLFFAGDMVLGYESDTVKLASQLTNWLALYKASPLYNTSVSLVAIPGNHETQDKAAGKKSFVAAERTFQRVMFDYLAGNNGPVITGLIAGSDSLVTDQSKLSYSFDYKNDHFIILNTDPVGRDNVASYLWAKTDVLNARAAGARHIFAIGHKPAYTGHFKTTADGLETKPAQRDSLWNMFEANQVDAFFSAHVHCADSIQPHAGKTWQLIAGNGGSLVEALFQNPPNAYFGYALVNVYNSNRVNVKSMGRDAVMTPATYQLPTPSNPTTVRADYDININPSIDHTPLGNTMDNGPFKVIATIKDNVAVTAAQLNFRVNGVARSPITNPVISGSTYTFTIPVAPGTGNIEYNIQANDVSGVKVYSTNLASQYYSFSYGGALTVGPSTSTTPYITPIMTGAKVSSVLTVGDSIGSYRMAGIPDGLGAYDNNDGTFTLVMNHEHTNLVGVTRAHGSKGAFVSKWIINKADLSVKSGADLMKNVNLWNGSAYTTYNAANPSTLAAFSRFCSADLPATTALYNAVSGLGTQERIFFNGEESGTEGRAVAHILTGANAGTSYQLPALGKMSFENVVVCPVRGDKTIVGLDDDGTGGQVYFYIGNKINAGTEIEKAGLSNGKLYGLRVSGYLSESNTVIPAPNTPCDLVDMGSVTNISGDSLNTLSNARQVSNFLRPEDGAWDPNNPSDYYFVTTNSISSPSRLWRMRFTNIASPELGGSITNLLNGTEGQKMLDNIGFDSFGHILMQEDPGNDPQNAKIWQYTVATKQFRLVAQHDSTRFVSGGSNFITQDEESSGIVDLSAILGPGKFLVAQQAHYALPGELVEGGQLVLLHNPDTYSSALGALPSSSQSAYVTPVAPGVKLNALMTVGDTVGNYRMVGIPDGFGAYDNSDGTFTLVMNHELTNTAGIVRAHGQKGAFVSKWIVNKSDLTVKSGTDLMRTVNLWNGKGYNAYTALNPSTLATFSRFCSADLPDKNALYNLGSGKGTQERIFFNGEESGPEGRAMAHMLTGPLAGNSYELPALGKMSFENVVACPALTDNTIIAELDDTGGGQVYFYVGAKSAAGSDLDKAGLSSGRLYGLSINGYSVETNELIPGSNTPFSMADLGSVANITGDSLNKLSVIKQITGFQRPEDGAWDPSNPNDFYFVTTNSITAPSRLWKVHFNDVNRPEAGGTFSNLLTGTEGQKMLDNMTIDKYGHIIMQEDPGNDVQNAKIWQYTLASKELKMLAQHDSTRFMPGGSNFLTQDEESSGIIDASSILGPGRFLFAQQAHYAIAGELAEGGQVLTLFNPDTYNASLGATASSSQSPYLTPIASGLKIQSLLSVNDAAANGYKMMGIPDGLGAFDNNDGTFTLLMNHEISSGLGAVRAHGSNGAFVSKWIINKDNLAVLSGSDLIRTVRLWNSATGSYTSYSASSPSTLASFSRFCSADLPAVNAFYNSATGTGTRERLFMNGEEAGDNGRLFAHIVTGSSAGTSYELPHLGKFSCENLLARPVASDKTVVAGLDDTTPGQVYFYIGTKTTTGSDVDKAGLTNGRLFGVSVSGMIAEVSAALPTPNTPFSLVDLGVVRDSSGTALNTLSNVRGVTTFLRPEDGSWDPQNPSDFYFVTTNAFTAPSRLWRLHFNNVDSPELGGTITNLLDGSEGHKMLDNLTLDNYGHIILQEDVGNNAHNGKVWQYTLATDELKLLAQHDSTRFLLGAANYLTQDEESSGVIDMQSILGPGKFLMVDQAHYAIAGDAVEGGQLLLVYNPDSFNSSNEISVTGNGIEIVRNSTIPLPQNNTDFGTTNLGVPLTRRIMINNSGEADLLVKSISFSGPQATEFSVLQPLALPIVISGKSSREIVLQFNALGAGRRVATVNIASTDFDEATYSFAIQGNSEYRKLVAKGNGHVIASGATSTSDADNTEFGSVLTGTQLTHSFSLVNNGASPLTISSVTVTGAAASDFEFDSPLGTNITIEANSSLLFGIVFNPSASGARSATIKINSNDVQQPVYQFVVHGIGVQALPDIRVESGSQFIANGDVTPSEADNTDFGTTAVGSKRTAEFSVRNSGTAPLELDSILVSGPHASEFVIIDKPTLPNTLQPGALRLIRVQFIPTGSGIKTANLTVVNSTSNKSRYSFALQGTATSASDVVETPGFSMRQYPNPSTNEAVVELQLESDAAVHMTVTDQDGRQVLEPIQFTATAGMVKLIVNTNTLSSGVYMVHLNVGGATSHLNMVVIH